MGSGVSGIARAVGLVFGLVLAAFAQVAPGTIMLNLASPGVALAETPAPAADAAPAPSFAVTGFRSAKFGMTEEEVRQAIASDFSVPETEIGTGRNVLERTRILSVVIPDVLPEGGKTRVSYIFGYRSKALIQVVLSWSPETDSSITTDLLRDNGSVLQNYFLSQGFVPDSVKTNVIVDNGLVLFRGADAAGHVVLLMLQGRFSDGTDGGRVLSPDSLELIYMKDPDNPDVFEVESGSF